MEGGFGLKTDPPYIKDNLSARRYVSAGQRRKETEGGGWRERNMGRGCTSKNDKPLLHQSPILPVKPCVGGGEDGRGGERRQHISVLNTLKKEEDCKWPPEKKRDRKWLTAFWSAVVSSGQLALVVWASFTDVGQAAASTLHRWSEEMYVCVWVGGRGLAQGCFKASAPDLPTSFCQISTWVWADENSLLQQPRTEMKIFQKRSYKTLICAQIWV